MSAAIRGKAVEDAEVKTGVYSTVETLPNYRESAKV
jgi:Tfp pilus assembly major pilin PilA